MEFKDVMKDYGHQIQKNQSPESEPWKPKAILHFQLKIKPRNEGQPLEFYLWPVEVKVGPDKIEEYVKSRPQAEESAGFRGTPWDIDVRQQSYLVLELDPTVPNWYFAGRGMSGKHVGRGHESDLRYLIDGETTPGPIKDYGCRVLYLKIGHREAKSWGHNFNLITVFEHENDRWMPVLFDPDVGNEGNTKFPPPSGGKLVESKGMGDDQIA